MLFCTTSLAARIERAECRLLTDSAAAIALRGEGVDVEVMPIAGGVATYTGTDSPLNKVAGLGFWGPVDEIVLDSVELAFPREVLERVVGDMAGADGFLRYLARREEEPAGGASMRLHEGIAQLCGAATLPAHRRRGVQSALLAERLSVAGKAGCDVAVVTTQPGSKSQQNVQRQGFELLYTRAVLVHPV